MQTAMASAGGQATVARDMEISTGGPLVVLLDIRIIIETEDGQRIALSADGVGVPRVGEPIADICENVSLTTAAENYAWVNTRQVWGVGTVNFASGKIHIDAYMQ